MCRSSQAQSGFTEAAFHIFDQLVLRKSWENDQCTVYDMLIICYCPDYFPRQKVVRSEGEWDYTELTECAGFQRQPESHRRIQFGARTCSTALHEASAHQPARQLAWRSPWGQSWKGWLCHPPSLCVFSSETSQSKDMTHAIYWQ